MITKNDIESIGNEVIYYIDDNNICYQFEPWDSFNEEQIEDAKAQLAFTSVHLNTLTIGFAY